MLNVDDDDDLITAWIEGSYGFSPEAEEEVKMTACPECNGTGEYLLLQFFHTCKVCNGKKKIPKE